MTGPHRRARSLATTLALGLVACVALATTGCGVPSSGGFEAIDDDDLGFAGTTTSSSTTVPDTTGTTVAATTTTIDTEPVTLYFLTGNQLSSVSIALARPASPGQVVAALMAGPPSGQVGTGLRTALPFGSVPSVDLARGAVTIDVPAGFFERIPPADQRLAVAQIVLTMTERGGIGSVQFTQGGAAIAVPRGSGVSTQPGEAVYHDDYDALLGTEQGAPDPIPGATTTSIPAPVATGEAVGGAT